MPMFGRKGPNVPEAKRRVEKKPLLKDSFQEMVEITRKVYCVCVCGGVSLIGEHQRYQYAWPEHEERRQSAAEGTLCLVLSS